MNARAEARAHEMGLANYRPYTELREMFKDERIHIVSICTPHHLHAEQAIQCAEAGKHLLIEKPIAITLESLRLGYEYEPNSVTIMRFANGIVGRVVCSIECVMPYEFKIRLLGDEGMLRNNQLWSRRWPGQRGSRDDSDTAARQR